MLVFWSKINSKLECKNDGIFAVLIRKHILSVFSRLVHISFTVFSWLYSANTFDSISFSKTLIKHIASIYIFCQYFSHYNIKMFVIKKNYWHFDKIRHFSEKKLLKLLSVMFYVKYTISQCICICFVEQLIVCKLSNTKGGPWFHNLIFLYISEYVTRFDSNKEYWQSKNKMWIFVLIRLIFRFFFFVLSNSRLIWNWTFYWNKADFKIKKRKNEQINSDREQNRT